MSDKLKLNTKDESLREVLSNGKKYFVPKFQRDYSWENEQWTIFWEDIENVLQEENEYHYMGYLVLQGAEKNQFKIIDGQQRLTTFSLLVLAAIKRLKEAEQNEQERMDELHKNFIGSKDLIKLKMTNKLKLNRNNDHYFNEAIIGENLPKKNIKRTVHLMRKAFEYFYEVFKNKTGEEIGKIIETISQNLLFTTIYVGSELNAYKVFETLNARGVQLSSADLLKNYLFSIIDQTNTAPDEVIDRLEEKWERIGNDIGSNHYTDYILCDWNSTHSFARKSSLFREIRNELDTTKKADNYLVRLANNSQLYAALLNYEDEFWKESNDYLKIKHNLYFLQLFNIKQPISLLYAAYLNRKDSFLKILNWIVVFSLRYNVICRDHPGDQEKLYNKICLSISQSDKDEYALLDEIKNEIFKFYPEDEKFRQAFADKTMLTGQSNKKARYLFSRLAEKSGANSIDETKLTIEHILPNNPKNEWINCFGENWQLFTQRIGNMALVTRNENEQLGQQDFEAKKQILCNSDYPINNVADYESWDSSSVESRQKDLAKMAVQLWRID